MAKIVNDFGDKAVVYTAPDCLPLPVLRTFDESGNLFVCVSCWQFTWEELKQIVDNDGKVYLHVYGGQPPVFVGHQNPLK